jgi:hypothetical protein
MSRKSPEVVLVIGWTSNKVDSSPDVPSIHFLVLQQARRCCPHVWKWRPPMVTIRAREKCNENSDKAKLLNQMRNERRPSITTHYTSTSERCVLQMLSCCALQGVGIGPLWGGSFAGLWPLVADCLVKKQVDLERTPDAVSRSPGRSL